MAAEPSHNPTPAPAHDSKKSSMYVAAPVDDDRLEPDALRGSEHFLQTSGVEDLNAARNKKLQEAEKKAG